MSQVLEGLGELRIAERIRQRLGLGEAVEIGPGDDAAVVRIAGGRVVLTVDTQREGTHFRREWIGPGDLGRRALAVAVSDLAAMGARPVCALCALVLPAATEVAWFDALLDGLVEGGLEFDCPVVGGDVSQPAPGVSLCVTAVGALDAGDRPLRREGAGAGDLCVVLGTLGHAAAGRALLAAGAALEGAEAEACVQAYLRPVPLVEGGRAIGPHAHAMMDISDGLSLDLARMCSASGVGARLEEAALVDQTLAAVAGPAGAEPVRLALDGGEDYALLAAVPRDAWEAVRESSSCLGLAVRAIGSFEEEPGLRLGRPGGVTVVVPAGWDPFHREAP